MTINIQSVFQRSVDHALIPSIFWWAHLFITKVNDAALYGRVAYPCIAMFVFVWLHQLRLYFPFNLNNDAQLQGFGDSSRWVLNGCVWWLLPVFFRSFWEIEISNFSNSLSQNTVESRFSTIWAFIAVSQNVFAVSMVKPRKPGRCHRAQFTYIAFVYVFVKGDTRRKRWMLRAYRVPLAAKPLVLCHPPPLH